jgi:hypothetical protein
MDTRFRFAMGAYAVLAVLAVVTLGGKIRLATLLLIGLFALKTVLHVLRKRAEEKSD